VTHLRFVFISALIVLQGMLFTTHVFAGQCLQVPTSSSQWANLPFSPPQSGRFSVSFTATPLAAGSDFLISVTNGSQTWWDNLAVTVRFNINNAIDVRSGDVYKANAVVPYTANTPYFFRVDIDVPAHTFSVFVSSTNLSQLIAYNYPFRTQQQGVTSLSNFNAWAGTNSGRVCDFVVDAKHWSDRQTITTDVAASRPKIALSDNGNAVAIWTHLVSQGFGDIVASYYTSATGWSAPQVLEAGALSDPDVGIDGAGRAIAVWQGFTDYGLRTVVRKHYVPGAGWGPREFMSQYHNPADSPKISMSQNGDALVVTVVDDGERVVVVDHYVAGMGWLSGEQISTTNFVAQPDAAIDNKGNATAIWIELGAIINRQLR
jgi:hypothetical protein